MAPFGIMAPFWDFGIEDRLLLFSYLLHDYYQPVCVRNWGI